MQHARRRPPPPAGAPASIPNAPAADSAASAELHPQPMFSLISFVSETNNARLGQETRAFAFMCRECGITSTTQTRSGPLGPGTLCNKCVSHLSYFRPSGASVRILRGVLCGRVAGAVSPTRARSGAGGRCVSACLSLRFSPLPERRCNRPPPPPW